MRAAVLHPDGLRVRTWADPQPVHGEALVGLTRAGVCGSDVHLVVDGTARPAFTPIVLGHEPAGHVVALGPDTEGPPPGTRVAVIPLITCGCCDHCRAGRSVICRERRCLGIDVDGCWAELISVPVRNLVVLPDSVSDELAAVATDCVATAYHALVARAGVDKGSRVAVWGAGGLGLAAVALVKALGASAIAVDPRERARAWAREAGADLVLEPGDAVARIAAEGGVDVAVELVGRRESVEGAVRSLDTGGRAVIVGIGAGDATAGRMMRLVTGEHDVVGSYGAEPGEVHEVIRMLGDGELEIPHLLGDSVPLDDVKSGIERLYRGRLSGSRVVLEIAG